MYQNFPEPLICQLWARTELKRWPRRGLAAETADVTVERLDVPGTQWRITGSYPGDFTLMTGGHDRIISRTTVAFFAHNGYWLGPPAFVSVGGREAGTYAPNDNNLD